MNFKRCGALLLSAMAVSGCTITGSTSFRDMSTAYRDVLESYANDNILINIVRASEHMPMTFLDMPSVVGSGTVSAGIGVNATVTSSVPGSVGGFFSAGSGSSYVPTATLSVNNGFNFTQSSLDNSSFMTSFLSDLKPEAIDSLTNNDVGPKSILYSLVIEQIELRDSKNLLIEKWVNDPNLDTYRNFQQALYRLIDTGLSTEVILQKQVLSAPMDIATLNKNMTALVAAYALPGTAVLPAKGLDGKPAFQLVRITPMTRMCLNKRPSEAELESQFTEGAFCNSGESGIEPRAKGQAVSATDPGAKAPTDDKKTLVIKLRSTRNIFDFMGSIVALQTGPNPKIIRVKNSDLFTSDRKYLMDEADESNSFPLLLVEKNKPMADSIVTVNYLGNKYSIPAAKTSASREVLTLLAEILTLNKVPGSIPASPAVLIK